MGNETSSTKQQFLGQKYIVTDHALRVGFRNKPDLYIIKMSYGISDQWVLRRKNQI